MSETRYTTKKAILKRAKEAIGIPFSEIDKTGRLTTGKGAIGTVIEESWFEYKPNSDAHPDFKEAGVELKVTPYIKNNNRIRAKERLVCNIINYMEEYDKTFTTSSFWHKCNTMLLMTYEHQYDVPKSEMMISGVILFSFPEEDLKIIEHDWEIIINKIRNGRAHEISEGDTMYLAACPKGVNSRDVREQPFSDLPAMRRAYSLKSSYMSQILNQYIFNQGQNLNANTPESKIITSSELLDNYSFEDYVISKVKPFYNQTQKQLMDHFGLSGSAKNMNNILLAKMLGIKGQIAKTEEFIKANIIPKTIRVNKNGKIKESMSFPALDFIKLSQETNWEESELYEYLAPTKFMFVIFQEQDNGEYALNRIQFWNINNQDLQEVGRVWKRTRDIVIQGVELVQTPKGVSNNFPKKTQSYVAHVRPHARNAKDVAMLPDGRMMTKQCFWLNNDYIAKQIKAKDSQ